MALGMQVLESVYVDFSTLQCCDPLGSGTCSGQSCDRGDSRRHCGAPDRFLIEPRLLAGGSIDDELNALALDEIDHIGAPFLDFVNTLHVHPGRLDHVRCASRGNELESHVNELPCDRRDMTLIVIRNTDEDCSLRRQFLPSS